MIKKDHTKNKIFFDLDGTLIDASERLYSLFCNLIPECNFTKKEYWDLKRNKINHAMILEKYFPKYEFSVFNDRWLSLIETEKYLMLDKVYEGVFELLKNLNKTNELYLLTARQSKNNLLSELKRLKLENYFKEILVTENKHTKNEILDQFDLKTEDIFITDMGKDIETGHKANIKTIAVTYGFMSKEKLIEYKPSIICDSIKEIEDFI